MVEMKGVENTFIYKTENFCKNWVFDIHPYFKNGEKPSMPKSLHFVNLAFPDDLKTTLKNLALVYIL